MDFGEIAYRGDQDQQQLLSTGVGTAVQFDPRSDELPNPREYQQPPQSYQPPAARLSGTAARRLRAAGDRTTESEPVVVVRGSTCPWR